jgi:hypothetical protein
MQSARDLTPDLTAISMNAVAVHVPSSTCRFVQNSSRSLESSRFNSSTISWPRCGIIGLFIASRIEG